MREIDSKALGILRINVLLISLVLTAVSIGVQSSSAESTRGLPLGRTPLLAFTNVYSELGLLFLLVSTALAGVTYTTSRLSVGIRPGDLREVRTRRYADQRFHEELVEGYETWIRTNRARLRWNAFFISMTILSVIYGVSFLALGVGRAFDIVSALEVAVVVAILVILTVASIAL